MNLLSLKSAKILVATNLMFQTARVLQKYAAASTVNPKLRYKKGAEKMTIGTRLVITLFNLILPKGLMWPRLIEYSFVLRSAENFSPGDTVLDIGSGLSPIPAAVSSLHPDALIVSTDLEPQWAIEQKLGYSALGIRNVESLIADSQQLPFRERSFDRVMCISTVEHVGNDALCMREIRRVMKDDGELIFTTDYTTGHFSVEPHGRVYDRKALSRLLSGYQRCSAALASTLTRRLHPLIRSIIFLHLPLLLLSRLLRDKEADVVMLSLRKSGLSFEEPR